MNNEHKNQNDTEFIDDLLKNSEFNFSGKNFIEKVDTLNIFNLYVKHPKERNK